MKPITDNELIAEFMGVKETKDSFISYGHDAPCWYTTNGLLRSSTFTVPNKSFSEFVHESRYHLSWDWLMPVVEKIIQIKGSHFIYDHTVLEIFMYGKRIVRIGDATMIGNYYNGVVEFIKWYNTQKS
jgi:hypothetical protein